MRKGILAISVLLLAGVAFAQEPKPTAESVMSAAKAKAKRESKSILVMFDASW